MTPVGSIAVREGIMAPLHLKLLGGFSASSSGGETVEVSGRKNQALLAYLALQSGKKLPRDKLLGLLWSDRGEAQARASLRQALVALRRDLGESASALRMDGDSVALEPQIVATDVASFERLIRGSSAEELREAARLYEGELLDGLEVRDPGFEEWLAAERVRLRDAALATLARLLERVEGTDAITLAQRMLALDPLREASHRALMRAYAANGQREQALRQYQACRDILRRDLQVEPSEETEALRRRLSGDRDKAKATLTQGWPGTADQPPSPPSDMPSIAVLPFENRSDDPQQSYFTDGVTEDIITELSRFRNLLVIAHNSSFAYKGKAIDMGAIARELGVQYVLEGSVRRAGQRVRITAQLIEAATGKHVWAERYDRELGDIFAVQDEVALSIAGALAVGLEDEFLARASQKAPENLQAYEHWLRGKRLIFLMGEHNLEARRHFARAAALDPGFSRAHSGLALTYQMEALDFPLPEDAKVAQTKSREFAERALALDETNHQAHLDLCYVFLYGHDCDRAARHIERATNLQPGDGDTLAHAGYIWTMIGDASRGIGYAEKALRVNPHHPDWYLAFLATGLSGAHRCEECHAVRLRAPEPFIDSLFGGAADLSHMGRLDEARRWAERGIAKLAGRPGGALAIAEHRVVGLLLDNNPFCRQEDRDYFAEGMRKAGVPG
jgi:TolB-like protein/Tfp pilus assembly protein PilF